MSFCNLRSVVLEQVEIELPEPLDDPLMRFAIELGQRRIVVEYRRDQRRKPGVLEELSEVRPRRSFQDPCCLDHRVESGLRESRFLLVEPNESRTVRPVRRPRVEASP